MSASGTKGSNPGPNFLPCERPESGLNGSWRDFNIDYLASVTAYGANIRTSRMMLLSANNTDNLFGQ